MYKFISSQTYYTACGVLSANLLSIIPWTTLPWWSQYLSYTVNRWQSAA